MRALLQRLRNFAKGVYIDDPSFSLGYRDPEDGVARDLLWAQMIRRQRVAPVLVEADGEDFPL